MAGRFEGLSNLEWSLFDDIFPKPTEKRERGMPHSSFPSVLNTLLYILITGCAWSDVPKGEIWAWKSSTYRWLKGWQLEGKLEALQVRILEIGQDKGLINWSYGAVDGSFSPRKPLKVLAAEKAYDCKDKRAGLPRRGIRPQWPKRVWKTKKNKGRPIKISVPSENKNVVSHGKKKYRRLVCCQMGRNFSLFWCFFVSWNNPYLD